MIDPSPQPSRLLRISAQLARWSLGLVLVFWLVLAAAWGTLHGFIVPRIGEWRVQVERLASQAVGAPVRIGAITAQSNRFFPTVDLRDVRVLDDQGRDALKLQRVMATVSVRSLLRLGLEQLYIEAPELDIRHLADGRWQVAGLDVVHSDATESPGLDWLLEQPELVIQKGRVLFTDEQRALPTVQWQDVDVVVRNRHWNHVLRVEATPTSGRSERLQLVGAFRQPLLPSRQAPWARWTGQWYASMALHQIPALPWPQAWGLQAIEAHGRARLWLDVQAGQAVGATLDVALPQVAVVWRDAQVADLQLTHVQGRFEGLRQAQGWQIQARDFSFRRPDGAHWAPSQWTLETRDEGTPLQEVRWSVDRADLAMASQVLQSVPAPQAWREALARLAPQGVLRQFQLQWQPTGAYAARGQVEQLVVAPQAAEAGVGVPGVEGVTLAFTLSQDGGQAQLQLQDGALHFPGVFEEARIPLDRLQAQLRWTVQAGGLQVEVPQAQFANADAEGNLQAMWRTGATPDTRWPGCLQLQGQLARANGARVYRYLPLEVPAQARHYVRDSVLQGEGQAVEFEVRGDLQHMPFDQPGTGRFYIKAPVHNVVYAFVPPALQDKGEAAWPVLHDLRGTLVFDGASMQVEQATTGFAAHPQLRMALVQAQIPDLSDPQVHVQARGRSDLNAALALVRQSPLADFTSHALDEAQAQGSADIALELVLPIAHLEQATVRGSVGFQNNGLRFGAQTPQLQQLQGHVQFHEQGFALQQVQGQTLGGRFRIEGGMPSPAQGVRLQARGTATAAGLQQDTQVPWLAPIAAHAQGQAAYSVLIAASQGAQHIEVRSDLQGMALDLPEPLQKSAPARLDFQLLHTLSARQEQVWQVVAHERGWLRYQHQPAQGVSGRIVLGKAPVAARVGPGVSADIQQATLDVDAWLQVLQGMEAPGAQDASAQAWLPQQVTLDVGRLRVQDRDLEQVRAEFSHGAGVWRGRVHAQHLAGRVQYHAPSATEASGRLFARLSQLRIPHAEAQRLNALPSAATAASVESLPALDIEVEHLEIGGKALGKLQLKASNSVGEAGRMWTLEQFDLSMREARWRANGYWGAEARGAAALTHLSFLLEMDSSGQLLERLGMPGVIRDGKGRLHGRIAWQGAPIAPDWPSMDGHVQMQVEKGQFLKVEPGMGKLLSVLSLQSLTRRINLDFRDVFSQGFAFDYVRGDVYVGKGMARTNNLQMKGLNAAVLMEGRTNLVNETQNLTVVVVPEINAMTASLAATAINPVVGLGSFLAQMFLRGPLMEAATRTFQITGTWADPVVEQVKNKVQLGQDQGEMP